MGSLISFLHKLNCCADTHEDSKIEVNVEQTRKGSSLINQSHTEDVKEGPKTTPDAQPAESHNSTARSSLIVHFDFDIGSILNEEELTEKVERTEHLYRFGGRYEGAVKAGQRNGFGTMRWSEAVEYRGNWSDNLPIGEGIMTVGSHVFQGTWKDATAEGDAEVLEARLEGLENWLQAYNEGYCKA